MGSRKDGGVSGPQMLPRLCHASGSGHSGGGSRSGRRSGRQAGRRGAIRHPPTYTAGSADYLEPRRRKCPWSEAQLQRMSSAAAGRAQRRRRKQRRQLHPPLRWGHLLPRGLPPAGPALRRRPSKVRPATGLRPAGQGQHPDRKEAEGRPLILRTWVGRAGYCLPQAALCADSRSYEASYIPSGRDPSSPPPLNAARTRLQQVQAAGWAGGRR